MRIVWLILGGVSVALAVLGAALPLLPTVPFLLLAAFCFSRSSDRLHDWLTTHPRFGPPISDWRAGGAIRRPVKQLASLSILAAFGLSLALGVPGWALALQGAALLCVTAFIWSRPENPPATATTPRAPRR